MWDSLWFNATLATMCSPDFGLVQQGAVASKGGRIVWLGPVAELPAQPERLAIHAYDVHKRLITPGLIDSHTHVVHAGNRWREYAMRTSGRPLGQTSKVNQGLLHTVSETRAASPESLLAQSLARAHKLLASGVTTLESKSGYGLDLENELKIMRTSREIGRQLPLTVVSTFLGAHAVAPEYAGRPDDYIDFLCSVVLPAALNEHLVDAVDVFCDVRGFTHAQTIKLYTTARHHDLSLRMHADQTANFDAGALASRFGALAADHLEHASEETVQAMAQSGTVATLLPGPTWTHKNSARPPVEHLRTYEVPIALATNCNPGSSPSTSPTLMMNMACHLFQMTAEEAVIGFTRAAAHALGIASTRGTLEVGKFADLAIWDVTHPAELPYYLGDNRCDAVVKAGQLAYSRTAQIQ